MKSELPWWLTMPPCRKCGESHVLTGCSQRLWFEVSADG